MIRLSKHGKFLIVDSFVGDMAPRHESQLAFWGFLNEEHRNRFVTEPNDFAEVAGKVSDYFNRRGLKIMKSKHHLIVF